MMKIPKTMSTQHPDNVSQPFFVDNSVIAGEEEIKEAYYAFSHLGVQEQLWDIEGKESDHHVVEKLLSRYPEFFEQKKLGKDHFITLRGPNPQVEVNQGKILLETLESIPRNYDLAHHFYQEDIPPIFEIAIPMTSSAEQILRVKDYYRKLVKGIENITVHDITIKEWVGDFQPETINVIPLIEEKEHMLNADAIVDPYLAKEQPEYQRVWLARSDPAMNYGYASAVLINKLSYLKLQASSEKFSTPIYPIIGCGSVPFRGNFRPDNVDNCLHAYPSVHTFTLQSAFKFDYPQKQVMQAAQTINDAKTSLPQELDQEIAHDLINKVSHRYQHMIPHIAPLVNQVSVHVPKRRKRRLHIGLFGYSRETAGVSLPRAITFCASMYSLGLPPECIGFGDLSSNEIDSLLSINKGMEQDLKDAMQFYNKDNLHLMSKLQKDVDAVFDHVDVEIHEQHKKITDTIPKMLSSMRSLKEPIERAAMLRKFLG